MTDIRIVRDYPHSPAKVWRAVTDPDLVPLWTASGRGGRPVGFSATVGNRFQLVAKPVPGWRGVVDCEVLEAREPFELRYSWVGDEGGAATYVTYHLEPHRLEGPHRLEPHRPDRALGAAVDGTRFTYLHTGFTGVGGFAMAKLLGSVRTRMLTVGLAAVLDDLTDEGTLRPGSTLRPLDLS